MTAESASDRQQQWVLVVRRSIGISDAVASEDAREAVIGRLEDQLRESGWNSPSRAIAEPIVDALMALAASGDLDDRLLPAGLGLSADTSNTRDAAHRLLEKGTTVVDPEHLVFDVSSEYPPEVVAVVEHVLDRVCQYTREQPLGE